MKYLSKQLSNEIKKKYDVLKNSISSEIIAKCQKMMKKAIERNSQIHSYKMEHPDTKTPFSISRNNNKRIIKRGIKNIEEAFNFGIRNFDPSNFNESFLRKIARRITPELYDGEVAQYRERGVNISGASTTPPYPYKLINYEIPKFVDAINKQLECKDTINRVETAIFAHLHTVKLHPFEDGNGRTSRMLQNIILYHYGIPVPVIEAGERHIYYKCLDKAISDLDIKKASGIRNGATEGEKLFYTLIASKINTSLDKIIETCRQI